MPAATNVATVSDSLQEVVPTVQYGNVTLGPVSITRTCPDTPEDVKQTLNEIQDALEQHLADRREDLLLLIRGEYAKAGK